MRGEQTANSGANAIDQKHPDLPLRGKGQRVRRPQQGLGRQVTMEVSVLVNTTVVIPDRPTNRAATLWIPIPEEATTMRP